MLSGRDCHCTIISLLLALAVFSPGTSLASPQTGKTSPDFKVVTTTGQTVTLESFSNHVLVLDFFATWCIPCRISVPHLVEMNRKYGKQGLQLLGMSADPGEAAIRSFADWHQVNYPMAVAGESTQINFGIRSVPVMFIIDKKGRIAAIYRGFTDEIGRSSENLIKKLLAE